MVIKTQVGNVTKEITITPKEIDELIDMTRSMPNKELARGILIFIKECLKK